MRETKELMAIMADMQNVLQQLAEVLHSQQTQLNSLHSQMIYVWRELSSEEPIKDAKNKLT